MDGSMRRKKRIKEEGKELLTVTETANILTIPRSLVRSWSDRGLLKSIRVGPGRHRMFDSEEVDRFKESGRKLLTVGEVSRILMIPPSRIRSWCRRGLLNPVRVGSGRHRMFDPEEVDLFKGDGRKLLTVSQVTKILDYCYNNIVKLSDNGILNPVRVGSRGDRMFDPEEVDLLRKKLKI